MSGRPGVLLIGGSSEIGLAIVEALAGRDGTRIILAGRPTPALDEAADRLRSARNTVSTLNYDTQWSSNRTSDLFRQAKEILPTLDVVVVSVGQLAPQPARHLHVVNDPDAVGELALEPLLRTNLVGPALVANEAALVLSRQGRGRLVVITSASAVRPRDQILGYSVAKQALDSFVLGLDQRTRPHGVRCHVVRPGQVRTRMTTGLDTVPFSTGPDQVAARVRRALTGRSAVVWSPAAMRPVTALLRRAPRWVLPQELR